MKRTLASTGAALLVVLTVVAAPALSLEPYRPAPVDFEMAAPSAGSGVTSARAGRAVVSRPLRAPKRFNLVGMRWRGSSEPAIAMRVRATGGAWSRWTPVPAHAEHNPDTATGEQTATGVSDPVWAGEADELQYRVSRPVAGLRMHFVNSTGSSTAARRAVTAVRGLANRAVIALATPATAYAQGGRPTIVTRAAWGARFCPPRGRPSYGTARVAFVHHTVTATTYTPAQAPAAVLAICRYHRNSNRWDDVGYNFLVDRYGRIYEGRAGGVDRAVIGAQAQGWNGSSTGIANLGTFSAAPQSQAAISAMARLIRWKLPLHGAPTAGTTPLVSSGGATTKLPRGATGTFNRVSGHRDGNKTSCPGTALYNQLPSLRRRVGSVGPAPSSTPPPSGDGGGALTGSL